MAMVGNLTTLMPWIPENPFIRQLTKRQLVTLSIIYLITGVLSFFGSCSIIFISIKQRVFKQRTVLPLFHLCVADAFSSFGIVIGAISNNYAMPEQLPIVQWKRNYCIVVTMVTTASFMVTFLLTINYALQTYIVLNDRLNISNSSIFAKILGCCNWAVAFPIISWVFPFALSIFTVFIDSHWKKKSHVYDLDDDICTWCFPLFFYENGASCPTSTETEIKERFNFYRMYKAVFLGLIGLTIFSVTILFYLVFKRFKQLLIAGGVIGRNQYRSIENVRNRTFTLFGALVVCWIFPLVLGLLLPFSFTMKKYYWMYVIEALTSPMQGFLNSIVYGWYNVRFRGIIRFDGGTSGGGGERKPLLDPTTQPRSRYEQSPTVISEPNSDDDFIGGDEFW